MYTSFNTYYREKYGCKVYRLSLDGGFTCPNRDGTLDSRGCIFCTGSGEFAESGSSIPQQLQRAKGRIQSKIKGDAKYIAYFQAFTGTYAPTPKLRELYLQAIAPEEVVELFIGTRPDCLADDVLALLKEINAVKPVTVELGLQTVWEETAQYIRRGYRTPVYFDAVQRLKQTGIGVVTHIIIGLPGETAQMAAETTRQAVDAGTDGVKFHLLHVLKGTDLAQDYAAGKFSCLTLEAYAQALSLCLDQVPAKVVVHRITGDGDKRFLLAPLWSGDKKRVLNYLNALLSK